MAAGPKTYITVRFADKVGKDKEGNEKVSKRVVNLFFNGGNDKNGNPVFSDDKHIAFVRGNNITILPAKKGEDGKMAIVVDKDGAQAQGVSRNLNAFLAGQALNLESKGLDVGQATITGPAAAAIVTAFQKSIAAAEQLASKVEVPPAGSAPGM